MKIGREINVVFSRDGRVLDVIIGGKDGTDILIFDQHLEPSAYYSKKRIVKTSYNRLVSQRDLLILNRLRLDCLVVIGLNDVKGALYKKVLMRTPPTSQDRILEISLYDSKNERLFLSYIEAFEEELNRFRRENRQISKEKRAIIVGCGQFFRDDISFFLSELSSLLATVDIRTVDSIWQRREPDTTFVIGFGKLKEILNRAEYHNADTIVFFNTLTPMQKKNIEDLLGITVMDRNQIILEIFAKRARSNEGKIQVELASLRYLLPRLTEKDTGLSRLIGGFKTKGPGETKLEMMRRQVRDRIAYLNRRVEEIRKRRAFIRQKRKDSQIPIVAIVGYTNAGKSTLLNSLTGSNVYAEDRLFATLDPTTRRFTFSDGKTVLFTDTVGFIRGLPDELKSAFIATFEEVNEADLILQVADASNRDVEQQIEAVEEILVELGVDHIPRILLYNKMDRIKETNLPVFKRSDGIYISALTGEGIPELLNKIKNTLFSICCKEVYDRQIGNNIEVE